MSTQQPQDPISWYTSIEQKCAAFKHVAGIESFIKHAASYSTIRDISNWQGIDGELVALQNASHVKGINQIVRCDDYSTKAQIDLVAGNGLAWVEVKTCNNSANFLSNAGFDRQARRLQQAAKSECNKIQFVSPKVVYFFPMGRLDTDLAQFLHNLGFTTATDAASLKAATDIELPATTKYNFDISAMLNLCSELSNPQGVIQEIFRQPNVRFIAYEGAVQRVEAMLNEFGSAIELKNWKHVLEKLEIIRNCNQTPKLEQLAKKMTLSKLQADIYGVGDFYEAITITSCFNLMRKAQSHNCPIQHVLHKPIPLSGEVCHEQF